jgi:DNA-binding CsgD family transcriptional regulator
LDRRSTSIAGPVAADSNKMLAARGDSERLMALFMASAVPMLFVDDERVALEANPPARAALAARAEDLRERHVGISYCWVADVLPGRHLIAFAPRAFSTGDGDGQAPPHLTRRELEVLELSADGLNGPAIAKALVLSTATVRTHFGHIYSKLEVTDRAAAVAKAMRLGLIS